MVSGAFPGRPGAVVVGWWCSLLLIVGSGDTGAFREGRIVLLSGSVIKHPLLPLVWLLGCGLIPARPGRVAREARGMTQQRWDIRPGGQMVRGISWQSLWFCHLVRMFRLVENGSCPMVLGVCHSARMCHLMGNGSCYMVMRGWGLMVWALPSRCSTTWTQC